MVNLVKQKGKLAVILGIDGCGKSSVVSRLHSEGYSTTHWKKLKKLNIPLNFTNPGEKIQTLKGEERLNFLKKYIFSEWYYLINPKLKAGLDVIANSFFFKFYAKEIIYKRLSIKQLEKLNPLTGAEIIIFLDTPPAIALERKAKLNLTPYEFLKKPDDFIDFQQKQREVLLANIKNYKHYLIDGLKNKNQIYKAILRILEENSFVQSYTNTPLSEKRIIKTIN